MNERPVNSTISALFPEGHMGCVCGVGWGEDVTWTLKYLLALGKLLQESYSPCPGFLLPWGSQAFFSKCCGVLPEY